jgi:hypothetical protein
LAGEELMTRYTPKKFGARKKALGKRPSVSPSLKGWITKWNHEVTKLLKKKRPSKKDLERLKALRKRLKETRALSHKPKAKRGVAARRKPKKGPKAKERAKSPKKRRPVKKPSSKSKKRPPPKKSKKRPEPKKRPPPKKSKKRPEPKKRPPPKKSKKRPKPKKPRKPVPPQVVILEPERPQEEPKPLQQPPAPPQVSEAITEQPGASQEPKFPEGVPQEPEISEGVSEGVSEEEAKRKRIEDTKRFDESLLEYERERQRERGRREKADKELKKLLTEIEKERERILGPTKPIEERLGERFDELLEIAERTGQTPPLPEGPINSEANFGERVTVMLKEYLTEETFEEMVYQIEQAAKTLKTEFPIWICNFMYSAAGKELFGYGARTLLSDDSDALKFQAQGFESTGIFPTRARMISAIRSELEALLDKNGATFFIHFAEIKNYERKSGEAQKKWRKERRAQYLEERRLASLQGKK